MRNRSPGVSEEGSFSTGPESRTDSLWELSRGIGIPGYADSTQVAFKTKNYWLYRLVDSTGISGRGLVANVAVFPNGRAVVAWCVPGKPNSVSVFDTVEDLMSIHGHGSNTILIPEE